MLRCIAGHIAFKLIEGRFKPSNYFTQAITQPVFYLTLVLVVIILIVPVLGWRFYFVDIRPTLSDRVRLKQRLERLRYDGSVRMNLVRVMLTILWF